MRFVQYVHAHTSTDSASIPLMPCNLNTEQDEIRDMILEQMEEQKRKFKAAAAQEKIERRKRREEARKKKEYEEETARQRAQEQTEAAEELMQQMLAAKNRTTGGGSTIASGSHAGSKNGSPVPSDSRPGSRAGSPSAAPFKPVSGAGVMAEEGWGGDDNDSLGLTVDGDFPGFFDEGGTGDETKAEGGATLMRPLGLEGAVEVDGTVDMNEAARTARFPVNLQGAALPMSIVRVDVRELQFDIAQQEGGDGRYEIDITAHSAPQHFAAGEGQGEKEGERSSTDQEIDEFGDLVPPVATSPKRGAFGATGALQEQIQSLQQQGRVFWTPPSTMTTGTFSTAAASAAGAAGSAQPKDAGSSSGATAKEYSRVVSFQPLQYRATSHHVSRAAAQLDISKCAYTLFGESQRVVLAVSARHVSAAKEVNEHDHDLAEMGLLHAGSEVEAQAGHGTVGTGNFEFLVKDVLKEWLRATAHNEDRESQGKGEGEGGGEGGAEAADIAAASALVSGVCSCEQLTLQGVLLNTDFAPVGQVTVQLALGEHCT